MKYPLHHILSPFTIIQAIKKPAGSNQAAPAALVNFRLLLLPSGPDKIHSMTPHGTQSSSPTDRFSIPHPSRHCKLFFSQSHSKKIFQSFSIASVPTMLKHRPNTSAGGSSASRASPFPRRSSMMPSAAAGMASMV